jgi:hypothetical protein
MKWIWVFLILLWISYLIEMNATISNLRDHKRRIEDLEEKVEDLTPDRHVPDDPF